MATVLPTLTWVLLPKNPKYSHTGDPLSPPRILTHPTHKRLLLQGQRAQGAGAQDRAVSMGQSHAFLDSTEGTQSVSQCSRSAKLKTLQLCLPRVPPARQMFGQAANGTSSLTQDGDEEESLELSVSIRNL